LEAAKKAQSASIKGSRGHFEDDGVLAIEALPTPQDIIRVSRTPGASGSLGYINRQSGWADAEAAMRYLRSRVESLNRVVFVQGTVQRLLFSDDGRRVLGARLAGSNQILHADLTILAAGAWTPTLLDLRGILQATGQVLAYIPVSDAEALALSKTPCQINLSTGLFVIPPPAPSQHIPSPSFPTRKRLFLKIARHAPGYSNVTTIPHPETDGQAISVSIPHTNPAGPLASQPLPPSATAPLRAFLSRILRAPDGSSSTDYARIASRPFELTRLCHYADTPTGDFLLDYHPAYGKTLFVASGGSGHAFKFLPVLGRCVVECLRGECRPEFRGKWAWRERRVVGEWSTQDGSRASDGLRPLGMEDVDQALGVRTKL
jgi:sarcosine oxidase / L-pipecolate oxidase